MEPIKVKQGEGRKEEENVVNEEKIEEGKEKEPILKRCSIFPQILVICLVLSTLMIFSYWALYAILSEKPGMRQLSSRSGIIMTEEQRREAFEAAWDESMNSTLNAMKSVVAQFTNCYTKRHARISTALLRWFSCTFIGNPPRTCLRAFVLNFSPCFDPTLDPKEQSILVEEFLEIAEHFHKSSGEFVSSIIPYSTCFLLHQKDIFHDTLECARIRIPRERKDTNLPTICNALDTISSCIIGGYQNNCDSVALGFAKTFIHGNATRNWSRKYIWKCPQRNATSESLDFISSP